MNKELNWKFDISTFRLIGRELITDNVTAIVELVKNSYDANAENVHIKFYNTKDISSKSKIVICDNGHGMTSNDIENKWMRIGTSSKRDKLITEEPYKRRVVGEKGIGRFAIDKLGSDCKIYTKYKEENTINILSIDWTEYSDKPTVENFTDVKSLLKIKKFNNRRNGTKIIIKNISEEWSEITIERLYKELAKIVSPINNLKPGFDIFIYSNEFNKFKKPYKVKNEAIKYASHNFSIKYDLSKNTQDVIKFNNKTNELDVIKEDIKSFGPIKFLLYYFNQSAKGNFSKNYKGAALQIDGIKIYRDGILTTPFAENASKKEDRRDILGIDKRRWSAFFDKVGSRDIIGLLSISKDTSPKIIDSTNRQDFIHTKEYLELKEFIISQLEELEKFIKSKKTEDYENTSQELKNAKVKINDFSSELRDLKKDINDNNNINIDKKIKDLESAARKAEVALKKSIRTQKEEEKEHFRKEKMFMSLMSLQTYSHEITHIIKTSIGAIKRLAHFNQKYFDNEKYHEQINKYNKTIVKEIDKLVNAIDFMSTYTKSEKNWEEFNVKDRISYVFEHYKYMMDSNNIQFSLNIDKNIILKYNNVLFEDILKNLINNSIKALSLIEGEKKIKITGFTDNDKLRIYISDNGIGIKEKDKNKIYEVYYTTTAEEGGNGMGLYMVKTNLEAIKGSIKLIDSEYNSGVTFELVFPFEKGK